MIGGRYSLDREIGRGGMGAVWLGRDEVLGRPVALKRIGFPPGAESPDADRAAREARLAARLSNPHIVAVYDLVDDEEQQYLVMEYVEGTNVSGLLAARGPLPPDDAAALLGQVADALAAAHAGGIVHRDVKPSNMLVDEEGQVKLSDFGIARAEADPSLTQTGLVTGSPAYLAPEVASGQTATDRSDVWSWGASLYHALAGHPPYQVQDNVLGTLYRIVHEEPPRLEDAGWLAPLLEGTMTRDPAQRWDIEQVRDFLRDRRPRGAAPAAVAALPHAQGEGTQVLSEVPPLSTGGAPPAATTPPPGGQRPRERRDRAGALVPLLLGAAVVAVLVVIAFAVGQGRDADEPVAAPTSPTATQEQPEEEETPDEADALAVFAEDYVTTATQDPQQGFTLLTSAYQEASGRDDYTSFWGRMERIVDFRVESADPHAGTVTYTYTYRWNGQRRTETVELTLERQEDGGYLIAGDRSI